MRLPAAAIALALFAAHSVAASPSWAAAPLYGVQGRMIAKPGQRDALIAILIEGASRMPGNCSYIVSRDASEPNAIWIHETWDSRASHSEALKLPAVQAAIARARPLIDGFDSRTELVPVGGAGLGC